MPPELITAIEDKLQQEEFMKSYEFRIQTAKREGERATIEAEAIKVYNEAINETLTESVLRFKGIEATLKLASSANARVVVLGSGKDGLPLILGNEDTASAAQSPVEHLGQTDLVETKPPITSITAEVHSSNKNGVSPVKPESEDAAGNNTASFPAAGVSRR